MFYGERTVNVIETEKELIENDYNCKNMLPYILLIESFLSWTEDKTGSKKCMVSCNSKPWRLLYKHGLI